MSVWANVLHPFGIVCGIFFRQDHQGRDYGLMKLHLFRLNVSVCPSKQVHRLGSNETEELRLNDYVCLSKFSSSSPPSPFCSCTHCIWFFFNQQPRRLYSVDTFAKTIRRETVGLVELERFGFNDRVCLSPLLHRALVTIHSLSEIIRYKPLRRPLEERVALFEIERPRINDYVYLGKYLLLCWAYRHISAFCTYTSFLFHDWPTMKSSENLLSVPHQLAERPKEIC